MNQDQTRTDEAQIRELVESWAAAVRHKDMKAILAHHAPDMLMFDVPPPLQLKGIEAYEASWSGFFFWLERGGTFQPSDLSVTTGSDVAFCHALIHCGNPPSSSRKDDLTVRLTMGFQKVNGEWTIRHEHHSEPAE
jgi:uncharacterized protein (TIGR02246 family)